MLTATNYSKGFLIDHEAMGGVTEDPALPGRYLAYLVSHTSGENLGAHSFATLEEALTSINALPRPWTYEAIGGCSGHGSCAVEEGGECNNCGACH